MSTTKPMVHHLTRLDLATLGFAADGGTWQGKHYRKWVSTDGSVIVGALATDWTGDEGEAWPNLNETGTHTFCGTTWTLMTLADFAIC